MSNLDHDEVGYGKPPRKNRFSSENQPRRRKSKGPKIKGHDLQNNIIQALDEDVSFTLNGKLTKAKAGEVLIRRLVKLGVSGTLSDQIKVVKLLQGYVEFDPVSTRDEIEKAVEDEHNRALEEGHSRFNHLLGLWQETLKLVEVREQTVLLISEFFHGAKSTCSCGAFDDCQEAEHAIQELIETLYEEESDDEAREDLRGRDRGWAPSTHGGLASQVAPDDVTTGKGPPSGSIKVRNGEWITPGSLGGDLADGMIGSD